MSRYTSGIVDAPSNPLHRERWAKLRTYRPYQVRGEPDDRVTWRPKERTEHFINGKHVGYSLAAITLPRVRFLEGGE